MHIPQEYWYATVQGIPESVRETLLRYLTRVEEFVHRPMGLMLTGSVGVGKTSAATVVAKEARCHGKSVYFVSVWELREDIRNRVQFDESHTSLVRCREVDLLVLDALRVEDAGIPFFGARELEELIQDRTSHKRATLLTTRMGVSELRKGGFAGLLDMMLGSVLPLDVKGPNLREAQHADLMQELHGAKKGTG